MNTKGFIVLISLLLIREIFLIMAEIATLETEIKNLKAELAKKRTEHSDAVHELGRSADAQASLKLQLDHAKSNPKILFQKSKHIPDFNGDTDNVEDWVSQVRSILSVEGSTTDKVYALLDKIDKKTRTQVFFSCKPEHCSVGELLDIICQIHKSSLTGVQLLQEFYNTNQIKGKDTIDDYFVKIVEKANVIKRINPYLIPEIEEAVKEKFAEGVYDINLKRELRRIVHEKKLSAFEVKIHAEKWYQAEYQSMSTKKKKTDADEKKDTMSESVFTDSEVSSLQKQIDQLSTLVKQLSSKNRGGRGNYKNGTGRGNNPFRDKTCYTCGKKGHISSSCWNNVGFPNKGRGQNRGRGNFRGNRGYRGNNRGRGRNFNQGAQQDQNVDQDQNPSQFENDNE